jgi:hypothetical protein
MNSVYAQFLDPIEPKTSPKLATHSPGHSIIDNVAFSAVQQAVGLNSHAPSAGVSSKGGHVIQQQHEQLGYDKYGSTYESDQFRPMSNATGKNNITIAALEPHGNRDPLCVKELSA